MIENRLNAKKEETKAKKAALNQKVDLELGTIQQITPVAQNSIVPTWT